MAKSRKRTKAKKEAKIAWGGQTSPGAGRINLVLGVLTLAVLIGGAVFWWMGRQVEAEFGTLARAGQPALASVETYPNDGQRHLKAGERQSYASSTPTSGPHDPVPTPPGVYQAAQPPIKLVHALEHGNIVFYYDRPPATVMTLLEDWAGLYSGTWDGIVVTPLPGLGETIVATAWRKRLNLSPFDPAAAAAFVEAYRGRGPENPVR